ncbi:unnamed protein product [Mytilus edulis]|uniref:Uncharacterized protein n=1 Tax=Mytilus edulis TaxID=6550 RepID=A0A8S3U5F3_MYTED|nr:unnamed protein product [Mytilus edulis]
MQPSKRMTCAQEEGEHGHASGVNKDGGNQQEDGYIRAVLQQLSASQKEHAPDPINISYNPNMNNVNSNLSWQDPQIYLKSANMDKTQLLIEAYHSGMNSVKARGKIEESAKRLYFQPKEEAISGDNREPSTLSMELLYLLEHVKESAGKTNLSPSPHKI